MSLVCEMLHLVPSGSQVHLPIEKICPSDQPGTSGLASKKDQMEDILQHCSKLCRSRCDLHSERVQIISCSMLTVGTDNDTSQNPDACCKFAHPSSTQLAAVPANPLHTTLQMKDLADLICNHAPCTPCLHAFLWQQLHVHPNYGC